MGLNGGRSNEAGKTLSGYMVCHSRFELDNGTKVDDVFEFTMTLEEGEVF